MKIANLFLALTSLGVVFSSMSQPITIPGSQFPIVTQPSNNMRFIMVYTNGGLSVNPNKGSNATITFSDLEAAIWNGGTQTTNAQIVHSDFTPKANNGGGVGQFGYSMPYVITNTLSYGFTNLHEFDNVVWRGSPQAVQLEIIKILDGHTAVVYEPIQNTFSGIPYYINGNASYDVYVNSANLWDVNGVQNDYQNHTHGAITSDGGLAVSTGFGQGDAQTGWGYGLRIDEGTNAWRIYAMHLGTRGLGLNFETGGHGPGGNPMFFSGMAPFESLELFADGSVSVGALTNWRGDLPISSVGKISISASNGIDANGLLSVKQSSRFIPQVVIAGTGQIKASAPYTLTNTLAYGFTNLHVWDNIVVGINQYEVISVNNASNVTVWEHVQVGDFVGTSNYSVYQNSANLFDVNGDVPDYVGHTHGAITSDGGIAVATGQYQAGWGFGVRISGGTNSWRISADDLSGGIGPVIQFLSGGCNSGNPFAVSTLSPYEALDVLPTGDVKIKYGMIMETNMPPLKSWTGGGMFQWNSNGANLYLLKSSIVNSNWISTNLIN